MKINYDIIRDAIQNQYLYQVEYIDAKNLWSVPVILTKERADKLNDYSVSRIRIIKTYEGLK